MSVYMQADLRCDGGPGPYDCEPPIYGNTAAGAREEAKRQGWLLAQPGGKDYCAEHRLRAGVTR